MQEYYARGEERDRLAAGVGALEFLRTTEILQRHLPDAPAAVADIGGGPGRYTFWLADRGYSVRHRDLVHRHVEQVADERAGRDIETAVADARSLDLADGSVDAVLLLGPIYHLARRDDRLRALTEAGRIVKPGGAVFVAAITRWATRIHGLLVERISRDLPHAVDLIDEVERTGRLLPLHAGGFTGNSHRPRQLAAEVRSAGLDLVDLVAVEGPASVLGDLSERLDDPVDRAVVLEAARALERVPELMGVGPHLVATARRPARPNAGVPARSAAHLRSAGARTTSGHRT